MSRNESIQMKINKKVIYLNENCVEDLKYIYNRQCSRRYTKRLDPWEFCCAPSVRKMGAEKSGFHENMIWFYACDNGEKGVTGEECVHDGSITAGYWNT